VLALLLALAAPLSAQGPAAPSEAAVKAAFLPKFARYVAWPAGAHPAPGQPFHLCIVGRDPFGRLLDEAAASETIDGRPVQVHRMGGVASDVPCHLAFVRGANAAETTRLLNVLRRRPVLTITDSRAGGARGMIHFTVAGGRVRFFIDEAAAAAQGLTISSRLLALALGVRQRRS
jgi:hypothetical protein